MENFSRRKDLIHNWLRVLMSGADGTIIDGYECKPLVDHSDVEVLAHLVNDHPKLDRIISAVIEEMYSHLECARDEEEEALAEAEFDAKQEVSL